MKLKFLKTVGTWTEGQICEVPDPDLFWLQIKCLAVPAPAENFDDLFIDEKPKVEPKPKVKVQPSNKANKAPENK